MYGWAWVGCDCRCGHGRGSGSGSWCRGCSKTVRTTTPTTRHGLLTRRIAHACPPHRPSCSKNKRIVLFDTLLPAGMKISDGVDAGNDAPAVDSDEAQSTPADRDDGDKEKRKGCSIEEIVAVLSHELGHWSHNHVLKGFVTGQLQMLVMMYTFNLLAANPAMYQVRGTPQKEACQRAVGGRAHARSRQLSGIVLLGHAAVCFALALWATTADDGDDGE